MPYTFLENGTETEDSNETSLIQTIVFILLTV
jgi:hypothetical protein